MRIIVLGWIMFLVPAGVPAQPVPEKMDNIPFLATYGPEAMPAKGDDDHRQAFLLILPQVFTDDFYVRIFDPGCSGEYDDIIGTPNSATRYSLRPVRKDLQGEEPGDEGCTVTFGPDTGYDGKWYSFGPFDPRRGKYEKQYNGHVFILQVDGITGDDGNIYRFFMSRDAGTNRAINGADAVYHDLTFQLWQDTVNISHIYPYIPEDADTLQVDLFNGGETVEARMVTVARSGKILGTGSPGEWAVNRLPLSEKEKGTSADIQFFRKAVSRIPLHVITVRWSVSGTSSSGEGK